MKTLIQRINEADLTEIDAFIQNNINGNYQKALNILTRIISNENIECIENYPNNHNKNAHANKLISLFESKLIDPKDRKNKKILVSIYKNFDIDIIDCFLNGAENKKNKEVFFENEQYNIFDLICKQSENITKDNTKDYLSFLRYLYEKIDFSKTGTNNDKCGEGELLIQLFFGDNSDEIKDSDLDTNKGDAFINGNSVEVKSIRSRASLGSSNTNIETLSIDFLNKIYTEVFGKKKNTKNPLLDIYKTNIRSYKKNGSVYIRCLGDDKANENIKNIINKFIDENNIDISKNSNEICEKILNIYISTLLSQYNYTKNAVLPPSTDVSLTDIILKNNPFKIKDNKLECDNLTHISGFIHLIGYKYSQNFDFIIMCKENGNCYLLDCTQELDKIYNQCKNIKFDPMEGRANESEGRTAVSKIKNFT